MRKLNLENYTAHNKVLDPAMPGKFIPIEFPYPVKDSILQILLAPELRLTGPEALKANMVAMKIESCTETTILLEEEEWNRLSQAVNKVTGFGRADVELIERITNAKVVEVAAK